MQVDSLELIGKRQVMAQALAFIVTAGASTLVLSTEAQAALSKEASAKAQKFLNEFGKQFLVQLDKNGGILGEPAKIAPPWAHKLLDDIWDYLFGR